MTDTSLPLQDNEPGIWFSRRLISNPAEPALPGTYPVAEPARDRISMTTITAYINNMQKSEVRHQQWEIADSLSSALKNGKVLTGQVGEIIHLCDIRADGNAVGKFLQRAESMPQSPFRIFRSFNKKSSEHRRTYRIKLKVK